MKLENFKIQSTDVVDSSNILFYSGLMNGPVMSPWFNLDSTQELSRYNLYGDEPLGRDHTMTIGNLLIISSHGEGIQFFRVSDAGVITSLGGDTSPVGTDTYGNTFAYHPGTKSLFVGVDGVNGIQELDITELIDETGTAFTYGRLVLKGTINTDTVGYSYARGLAFAGDWLYYSGDDTDITEQGRWNVVTDVHETLTVVNKDENMDKGHNVTYDDQTDRIFVQGWYNGQIWCTVNASTAGAITYQVRYEAAGIGNDGYTRGFAIDKDNRNYIYVESNKRIAKVDITNAVNGTNRDVPFAADWASSNTWYWYDVGLTSNGRWGTVNPDFESDLIKFMANDGWYRKGGWLDQENGNPVVMPRQIQYHQSRDYYEYDYEAVPVLATSTNGTKYWLMTGYGGGEGHAINVFPEATGKITLCETAHCTVGSYQFADTSNIEACSFPHIDILKNEPSGTNMTIQVSNNNGSTYETYNEGTTGIYQFTSTGNALRIKFSMSGGSGKTAAYLYGRDTSNNSFYQLTVNLISNIPDVTKTVYLARYKGLRRRFR